MTPAQLEIAQALRHIRTGFNPFAARFIKDMVRYADEQPAHGISERQEEWLYRLAVTFRRQLPTYVVARARDQALKLAWRKRDRRVEPPPPAPHPFALPGQMDLFVFPAAAMPAGGGSGALTPETAREHLA